MAAAGAIASRGSKLEGAVSAGCHERLRIRDSAHSCYEIGMSVITPPDAQNRASAQLTRNSGLLAGLSGYEEKAVVRRNSLLAILFAVAVLRIGAFADAATLTVTTAADSGPGTLREAMTLAEANGEADEIVFGGDYTIVLASTLPTVTTEMTIRGNGWDRTIIDGGNPPGGSSGVTAFLVYSPGNLTLDGVMVRRCYSDSDGGAIEVGYGLLRVVNSALRENTGGSYGGAIVSENSNLLIQDSAFDSNQAGGYGGAVAAIFSSNATIERSTFAGNSAFNGGALTIQHGGQHLIDGCTFADNTGSGAGAAALWASVEILNSTFSNNQGACALELWGGPLLLGNVTMTSTSSGGVCSWSDLSQLLLSHTLLSHSPHYNCSSGGGPPVSLGHNLEDGNSCNLTPALGDLINTNPLLGPLQDNGGPTLTQEPQAGSPAIDGGSADCGLSVDQRGAPRPADGDGDGIAVCDIGAVEVGGIFGDGFETGDTSAWSAVVP